MYIRAAISVHVSRCKCHDDTSIHTCTCTTNRQGRAAKNGRTVSFVHGHRGLSRLTTNWNCARFFSSNLKDMWQQYKAQIELFFFSWVSLFNNTCSSERLPMTWVRSHKDCYFWMLNLSFIKNHNTLILRYLVKVSIFALWQKYRKSSGHLCIVTALVYMYQKPRYTRPHINL